MRWLTPLRHQNHCRPHLLLHRATLVNLKPKWAKDRSLDRVVSREKHLPLIHHLISSHYPDLPISPRSLPPPPHPHYHLVDPAAFLLRYPALFAPLPSSPLFSLTPAAVSLRRQEFQTLTLAEPDLLLRLRKLLMLSLSRSLPLHSLLLLRFDLGLDPSFPQSLIPRYPDLFSLRQDRLHLLSWDPQLAVSALQKAFGVDPILAFPVKFTRGFGLRKKSLLWLKEWQTLPYVSPYAGIEGLDPRTDLAEKRMVGVFHELLSLTVAKKTERRNVSNLRKVLGLPQKFTKVFGRHPGIFYLSRKLGRETVVLREGYGGSSGRELVEKSAIVEARERYLELMRVRRDRVMAEDEEEDDDGGVVECESEEEEG